MAVDDLSPPSPASSALGTFDRDRAIPALADTQFDVLVIGGGITGAGVALDAASRGLRTALVERDDFSSGTSSKSSKLVHGGLRYLQNGDVKLVYQALAERNRLLKNAPHLVQVLPFVMPIFSKDGIINRKLARALGSAMWAYDLTGGLRIGKRHERLNVDETIKRLPFIDPDKIAGSYLYYDARADDARLTLTIARTAALDFGATIVNHAEVVGLLHDESEVDGVTTRSVAGARLRIARPRSESPRAAGVGEGAGSGADESIEIDVRSTFVVNATGVWADQIRTHDEGTDPDSLRPAKGIHVTVPRHRLPCETGGIVPVRGDRRSVFVIPEGNTTYIGTTDTDYQGPLEDPQVTDEDITYLLNAINSSTTVALTEADVLGTWAGLRPLVKAAGDGRTADLSRSHKIHRSASRLISITGGKLTTYREMAADTVDQVIELADNEINRPFRRRCRTAKLEIRGADGHDRSGPVGVPATTAAYLRSRYGGEAEVAAAMINVEPTLAEPLADGLPYLAVDVVFAARYEMAVTLDDVLSRRTRSLIYGRDASLAAAPRVAELLADELGWTPERTTSELAAYRSVIDAEVAAAAPSSDGDGPESTDELVGSDA